MMQHKCKEWDEVLDQDWKKIGSMFEYGNAIGDIEYDEDNKHWKVTCHEYGSPIVYCPYCGIKLEKA
jgi:hypothetical protein